MIMHGNLKLLILIAKIFNVPETGKNNKNFKVTFIKIRMKYDN